MNQCIELFSGSICSKVTIPENLIDDKLHNSVMTLSIIEGIIKNNPSVIESGTPTQYKSKFVFAELMNLALKFDIGIVVLWRAW